jgi:hypothetical protein
MDSLTYDEAYRSHSKLRLEISEREENGIDILFDRRIFLSHKSPIMCRLNKNSKLSTNATKAKR